MKKTEGGHAKVIIPFERFNEISPGLIEESFVIPKRIFPPSFLFKNENFFLTGYFVSYDGLNLTELPELCTKGQWEKLANLNAEFLIFYWDRKKGEICVLSDQSGKFPCYFRVFQSKLLVSTDLPSLIMNGDSLNLDLALDYLTTGLFLFIYDETLIKEINQIPPGTLLRISNPPEFNLQPLVDINKFTFYQPKPLRSNKFFANGVVEVLGRAVEKRLKVFDNLRIGAELSSGLDSSLICYLLKNLSKKDFECYCAITQKVKIDTDVRLVKEFAKKSNLSVRFNIVDDYFPFNKQEYLEFFRRYPPSLTGVELAYESMSWANRQKVVAYFQGLGGDEAFKTHTFDFWLPFKIQEFYFMTAWRFKLGINKILNPSGLKYLISQARFEKRRLYPNIYSPSAINANLHLFPIAWDNQVWLMTPFVDPEVVQFTRLRMPREGLKAPDKRELLSGLENIYVKEQFRTKMGDEKLLNKFLSEKQEFIIKILERSMLRNTGWFRVDEILENIKKGHIGTYLKDDAAFYLEYFVRLEYFIQKNNISVQ